MSVSPDPSSVGEGEHLDDVRRPSKTNWSGNFCNDQLLFDLIDAMDPIEKDIILMSAPRSRPSPTKAECCAKLAMELFEIKSDEQDRMGKLLSAHINNYQKRYAKVLRSIGPVASRKKYEDLRVGGKAHTILEKKLKGFPVWKRLHVYWRTSPYYNPYFIGDPNARAATRSIAKLLPPATVISRRGRARKYTRIESPDDFSDDESEIRTHDVVVVKSKSIDLEDGHIDLNSKSKHAATTSNEKGRNNGTKRKVTTDDDEVLFIAHNKKVKLEDDDQLTACQRHEREMAQLRVEEARCELEKEKIASERQAKEHEFQLTMVSIGCRYTWRWWCHSTFRFHASGTLCLPFAASAIVFETGNTIEGFCAQSRKPQSMKLGMCQINSRKTSVTGNLMDLATYCLPSAQINIEARRPDASIYLLLNLQSQAYRAEYDIARIDLMSASSRQDSDVQEGFDDGCDPVNWIGDSSNDQRLLDLIDLMDPSVKKSLLMTPPGTRTSPTKKQCCIELALKFFSIQPHERFRKGNVIRSRIKKYSRKYAEVLRSIGPEASRMKFEEFPATGEIHDKIVDALEYFPAWKRLHVLWRTSPHFNPYFIDNGHSSTQSTPARSLTAVLDRQSSPSRRLMSAEKRAERYANRAKQRKCHDDHRETEVIDVDDLEDVGHTDLRQNVKGSLSKSRNSSATTRVGNISRGRKRSRLSFETDSDELDVDQDQLTSSQKLKHDRHMAELRLEEAKVELEKQKISAEMQMRKQEFKLCMIKARGSRKEKK